jgi:hypothetical protein
MRSGLLAGAVLALLAVPVGLYAAEFAAEITAGETTKAADNAKIGANARADKSTFDPESPDPQSPDFQSPNPTGSFDAQADAAEQSVQTPRNTEKLATKSGLVEQAGDWKRASLTPQDARLGYESGILPKGIKSILKTNLELSHGQFMWDEEGVAKGKLAIFVDLRRQMISVFRDGHEIGTAVIVYGAQSHLSPTGSFPILRRYRDYHSRSYDAPMPYSLFITNDGVALHGSPMSATRATHGCIGLPLEFARRVFELAKHGDVVQIVRSDPKKIERIFATAASNNTPS